MAVEDPRCADCTDCPPEDRCLVTQFSRIECEYCDVPIVPHRTGGWTHTEWPNVFDTRYMPHTATPKGSPCEFCHNEPVRNAAKWVGGGGPDTLPCPRCGVSYPNV